MTSHLAIYTLLVVCVLVKHSDGAVLANQDGVTRKWPTNVISVRYPLTYSMLD